MKFKFFDIVSFHMSERTHFDAIVKANPKLRRLESNDVVALLSRAGDQLVWIHGYEQLADGTQVLRSTKLRLARGTWSVFLLKEYAERVGLRVDDWSVFDAAMRKGLERTRHDKPSIRDTMKTARANITYELLTANRKKAA